MLGESGRERNQHEKYYTPAWVTEALLEAEAFPGLILEPAAGDGGIAKVAARRGYEVWGGDIAPETPEIVQADFLSPEYPGEWEGSIITNPPFGARGKLAEQFIEKALEMTRPHGGKVAMLLRVDFDSAKTRRHLFADHPAFTRKYVLTKRILWSNLVHTSDEPKKNHAWFVWDWDHWGGPASMGYLP